MRFALAAAFVSACLAAEAAAGEPAAVDGATRACVAPVRAAVSPDLGARGDFASLFLAELCGRAAPIGADAFTEWFASGVAKTRRRFADDSLAIATPLKPADDAAARLSGSNALAISSGFGSASPAMQIGEFGAQNSVCAVGRGERDGGLQWNRPDQWGPDSQYTNTMVDARALLVEARKAEQEGRAPDAAARLVGRWLELWRDFASNNWRCAAALADDPALREKVLRAFKVAKAPPQWGSKAQFSHQFYLAALVESFVGQYVLLTGLSDETLKAVDARKLAEAVYFVVVYPFQNLLDIPPQDTRVTNQWLLRLQAVADVALVFDEFARAGPARAYLEKAIECAGGPAFGGGCKDFDTQADGSGAENCYNYMRVATDVYADLAAKSGRLGLSKAAGETLASVVRLRRAFQDNLITPLGTVVQCKNRYAFDAAAPQRLAPPKSYRSAAFPYTGLYAMRNSWGRDALYMALTSSRRGGGHEAEDAADLALEAYGRTYLSNSPGEFGYFGSSFSKNTISVDGLSQARTALPRHAGYDRPQRGRWATTPEFDFAEAIYDSGYGRLREDALSPPSRTVVADVTHRRVAIFIKSLPGWLVVDQMLAPAAGSHDYRQLWNFDEAFDDSEIAVSGRARAFRVGPAGEGLAAYQLSTSPLAYRQYRGSGWSRPANLGTESALNGIPLTARGWRNAGGGYRADRVVASPTIESGWRARGRSVVATLLVPSKSGERPLRWMFRTGSGGRLRLVAGAGRGDLLAAQVTPGPAGDRLVVALRRQGRIRAVVSAPLDHDVAGDRLRDGSGVSSGRAPAFVRIGSPAGFAWTETADGPEPRYGEAPESAGGAR